MKKLPKMGTLKFKLNASKELAKIGGCYEPFEPPLFTGLGIVKGHMAARFDQYIL